MQSGILTVVCGPMRAGKSTHLVNELNYWCRRREILALTHAKHTRSAGCQIVSRRGASWGCTVVDGLHDARMLLDAIRDASGREKRGMVAIDEIQFFEPAPTLDFINKFLASGIDVIACGLRFDWMRNPFEITANLISLANYTTEFRAPCARCGNAAQHTLRLDEGKTDTTERIAPGKFYEVRCAGCWEE